MTKGILYVATGEEFVEEAQLSAETVRETMGDIPIALVSDEKQSSEIFDDLIILENPDMGFRDKILGLRRTPFNKTIFLDTDTLLMQSIFELFDLLDRFDIAVTHNQNRDLYTDRPVGVPEAFPEYNTGVISFEKNSTINLFDRWLDIYDDDTHLGNQPSFRRALYEEDVQISTLPQEYNFLPRYPGHIAKDVNILHGRLLDIDTPGAGRSVYLPDVKERINETSGHRVFSPGGIQLWPEPSLVQRFANSIQRRGVGGTIQAGFKHYIQKIR